MKDNKFNVYDYKSSLKEGEEINLYRSIYANSNNLQNELDLALADDLETLQENKVKSMDTEKEVYNKLLEGLSQWQEVAEKTRIYDMAIEYKKACLFAENMETTNNQWLEETEGSSFRRLKISNKTYIMFVNIYTDTKYKNGKEELVGYTLSYNLRIGIRPNTYDVKSVSLANIDRKKFKDEESLEKYLEGRKKFFSKYFMELYPPVLEEYSHLFEESGKLLRCYKIGEIK